MSRRQIDAVVVCCAPRDQHFVRICVGSIRYWYPNIPILLLKDQSKQQFSTSRLERLMSLEIFEAKRPGGGWGLTKIEAFLVDGNRRFLLLDSDTVMLGNVLEHLEQFSEDFVVTGVETNDQSDYRIKRDYVDIEFIKRQFDSEYEFPGYGFNSGHVVVTEGILDEADFSRLVEFSTKGITSTAPKGAFPYADQGILNYVLEKKRRQGKCTVRYDDFWYWSGLPEVAAIRLDDIRQRKGTPRILHWAGTKNNFLSKMERSDILEFFERQYYASLPFSEACRIYARVSRIGAVAFRKLCRKVRA